MPRKSQQIDKQQAEKFAQLRTSGSKAFDDCIQSKIKDLPTLDKVAMLSETGRLFLFYEAVGHARLEGHSWLTIVNAATGETEYKHGKQLSLNYQSFCKNNNIEPVKIRRLNR